mgnify:FL=1
MNMIEPEQWLRLLHSRMSDDDALIGRMTEQIKLLDRANYPLESELEDESAALTPVERLVALGQSESKCFDPNVSIAALRIMERAYEAAAIDLGARLLADMLIGQESEHKLHKRWVDWFGAGAYWQQLVRREWHDIATRAAALIKEWADSEGAKEIEGADAALTKLVVGIRELRVEDVIPASLLDDAESECSQFDHNW